MGCLGEPNVQKPLWAVIAVTETDGRQWGSEAEARTSSGVTGGVPTTEGSRYGPKRSRASSLQAARCRLQPGGRRGLWLKTNTSTGRNSPLRPTDDHIHLPAAAHGANKPIAPFEEGRLSAPDRSPRHLAGGGLCLTAARSTPDNQPDARLDGVPERHRRAVVFHPGCSHMPLRFIAVSTRSA